MTTISIEDQDCGIEIGSGMNKEEVWANISESYPDIENKPILITLDCGCKITYKGKDEFPGRSIRCKHGNYFIRYADYPYISWKKRLSQG